MTLKSCRKFAPKASPRPLFNCGKKNKMCIRNSFKSYDILKVAHQKALKKSTFSFLPNPVPFNGPSYQKRGLKLVTNCSSGYKTISEKFLDWLYIIWPSLMMKYKRLLSYSKNYICKFMQANSRHHKFFNFHLSFCIWKVCKGKKLQNLNFLRMKKAFLMK